EWRKVRKPRNVGPASDGVCGIATESKMNLTGRASPELGRVTCLSEGMLQSSTGCILFSPLSLSVPSFCSLLLLVCRSPFRPSNLCAFSVSGSPFLSFRSSWPSTP
ncbi:unnamed protein product, partial [Phaeothamnion confervicola]